MGWHNLSLAFIFMIIYIIVIIAIKSGVIIISDDANYLGSMIFAGIFLILLAIPDEKKE